MIYESESHQAEGKGTTLTYMHEESQIEATMMFEQVLA